MNIQLCEDRPLTADQRRSGSYPDSGLVHASDMNIIRLDTALAIGTSKSLIGPFVFSANKREYLAEGRSRVR